MDLSVGGSGPRLAQRVVHLRAEGAYHVLAQAQALEAEGRHILHLEVGEPDFLASEEILDSGVEALRAGKARYNPPAGLTALRQAIAEFAGRQRGIDIRPSQVLVSPGAKPNMFFPTLALIEPGDDVLYPDPFVPEITEDGRLFRSVPLNAEEIRAAHCVVITTDHSALDYDLVRAAAAIVDTRDAMRARRAR